MATKALWILNASLLVAFFSCLWLTAHAGTYEQEKQLVADLLANHSTNVIPRRDTTSPIYVYFVYYLVSLGSFDVVHETLSTTGFCAVYWWVPEFVWNSTAYGNIDDTTLSQKDVWTPDMALRNNIHDYKKLGSDSMYMQLYSSGWIYWYPYQLFESSCSVDITYFPFDIQRCDLQFSAWSYELRQVQMYAYYYPVDISLFDSHPIWDIIGTDYSMSNSSQVSSMSIRLTLKRKPLSFILSVIAPTILLSILNLFSFVLPCESGERAGYSITVFLSFVVFYTIVTTMLPENSDSSPIVGDFILCQTIMSTVISLISLTLMRFYFCFDDVEVPAVLLKAAKYIRMKPCRKACCKCCKDSKVETLSLNSSMTSLNNVGTKEPTKLDLRVDNEDGTCKAKYNWKYMVNTLDIVMFYVTLLVLIVSTCVCFGMATAGPSS